MGLPQKLKHTKRPKLYCKWAWGNTLPSSLILQIPAPVSMTGVLRHWCFVGTLQLTILKDELTNKQSIYEWLYLTAMVFTLVAMASTLVAMAQYTSLHVQKLENAKWHTEACRSNQVDQMASQKGHANLYDVVPLKWLTWVPLVAHQSTPLRPCSALQLTKTTLVEVSGSNTLKDVFDFASVASCS